MKRLEAARMIYVTVERTVRRRPEIVWDFLTDVTSLTAWAEGIVEATVTSEPKNEPTRVGMTIDLVRRTGRERAEATAEVTAWRPPSLLALETRLPGLLLLDRATLAPHAEKSGWTTLGIYTEIVYGSALTEFFARPRGLLGASPEDPAVQGIYERSVDALVKRIEAMSAVPYR